MHSSAVLEPPTDQNSATLLAVDSDHQTEVRHPLSLETGPCACRVKIFTRGEGILVVVSEKPSAILLTDTYAIEQIASEILSWAVTSADRRDTITWIAHIPELNPATFNPNDRFFEIKFDRFLDEPKYQSEKTRFGVFCRSNWQRISHDWIQSQIGTMWE